MPSAGKRPSPSRARQLVATFAGLAVGFLTAAANAQSLFADDAKPPAQVMLHAGWAEIDGRRVAGLRMDLEPGWKTYWRAPGSSGLPPQFDWSGSKNVKSVEIDWPTPIIFDTYGTQTIGYKNQMVLPLTITPEDPQRPIRLRLALFYGVCEEVCVPGREDLALDIAPGADRDGAFLIETAIASTPQTAAERGLTAVACEITGADATRDFSARITLSPTPEGPPPVIVAEGPSGVSFGALSARVEGSELVATGEAYTKAGAWIERADIRLTILDGDRGVDIRGCASG